MTSHFQGSARNYRGRFAPSPSGPLHNGSLLAAMASYLGAHVHHCDWLLRIEDIHQPRVVPGADRLTMQQLTELGMQLDGQVGQASVRAREYKCVNISVYSDSLKNKK